VLHAGVRHDAVELPEAAARLLHHPCVLLGHREVGAHRVVAGRLQIHGEHPCAGAAQGVGDRRADSRRRSGHEIGAVVERAHADLLTRIPEQEA
jgi:hypothetical protein